MLETGMRNTENAAAAAGLSGSGKVFWNLAAPALYERAIARGEARLSAAGALAVETPTAAAAALAVAHVVVREADCADLPDGVGSLDRDAFLALKQDLLAYAAGRTLFAQDLHVAIAPGRFHRLRVFAEHAWQALALRNLMPAPTPAEIEGFVPDLTLFCLPHARVEAERYGLPGPALVAEDRDGGLILVGGLLDLSAIETVLVAHVGTMASAVGTLALTGSVLGDGGGDLALLVDPAGAGHPAGAMASPLARALAADPRRLLAADGPLGWHRDGVFGLCAGRRRRAPDLDATVDGFGTVMENVPLAGDSREPDFAALTPAARATIAGVGTDTGTVAGRPRRLVLTSCDGFGVLPPIARLTASQAVYHLLSGYTAPADGREGPRARFAPPQRSAEQAHLTRALIAGDGIEFWLVNTGWSGGQAGRGTRIPAETTHLLVAALLDGALADATFRTDPHFGFEVPVEVEGVEARLLDPEQAWANRRDLTVAARRLVDMFAENFARFAAEVDPDVREAQPRIAIAAE